MGFRYRKSIKIGGARINLSKSGVGYSVGTKGFRVTRKAGGGTRTTASIPGTGMSYVKDSKKQGGHATRLSGSGNTNTLGLSENSGCIKTTPSWNFAISFLIWIGVWFGSFVAFLFAADVLFPDGEMNTLYAFAVLILPFVIATKVASYRRKKQKSALENSMTEPTGIPEKDEPKQSVLSDEQPVAAIPENSAAAAPASNFVKKTYHVAGTTYHEDAILSLSEENADYEMSKRDMIEYGLTDERVWEYKFNPSKVELIPEPDNPHDPNAVKVIVDGEHVGYIKRGSCKHVLKLIAEDRILRIDCEIGGGNYKIVREEYDDEKEKDVYTLERDKTNYFAVLTIREKAEE